MHDRREADRTRVAWYARLRLPGQASVPGLVRNVSVNGLYVETTSQFKVGSTLQLAVRIPVHHDAQTLALTALIVRHVLLADMRGHGYGLQIAQMSDDDCIMFDDKLAQLLRR